MALQATLTTTIPAPGFLFDFAFSPDGRWLALATSKRTPVVEIATGRTRLAVRHRPWRGVLGVAFSPDGRLLATCGQWDRAARIWDAATGRQLHRIPHEFVDYIPGAGYPKVQAVAFSPDGRWLAGSGKITRIWDATSGEERLGVSSDGCWEVAFSPDGRLLATTGSEKAVRVWDTASGEEVVAFSHDDRTWDVVFGPDGRWLAVAGGDTARVWDTHSGEELLVVHNEASPEAIVGSMSVAFSADRRLLATTARSGRRGLDYVVRVWQLGEAPMGVPAPPSAPGDAAPARVRGRVELASERGRSVEAPVGAVRVSQRTRTLKERLRAAAVGRLGQGEELLVVTYAHRRPPAILGWAFGLLMIWWIALIFVDEPAPVAAALLGAGALFVAYALITRRWLGVVLTDRRLLLWSTVPVTRLLRGVLLEVPRGQVSMQLPFVLRFDETVGHAPISLSFTGEFTRDEVILQRALASSEG